MLVLYLGMILFACFTFLSGPSRSELSIKGWELRIYTQKVGGMYRDTLRIGLIAGRKGSDYL